MTELFTAGLAIADVHLAAKWREEEIKYRKLEILRRQIDEKVEQLRSIANLAALIAGFNIVVFIEINVSPGVPEPVLVVFGVLSAITVCLMCLSFVTCTLMLVGVLKAFDLENAKMPFRRFWAVKCEEDWMRAFNFFTIGVPVFILNLALAAWVKHWGSFWTAGLVTVVCAVALLLWVQIHNKWGSYLAEEVYQEGGGGGGGGTPANVAAAQRGATSSRNELRQPNGEYRAGMNPTGGVRAAPRPLSGNGLDEEEEDEAQFSDAYASTVTGTPAMRGQTSLA